jgi:hypothetical protein
MCYHPLRREALARLEHETGPTETTSERTETDPMDERDDPETVPEHDPDEPDLETVQRPEPVGFA